ncbi:MAG: hypothetical protein AAF620_06300 [Bacteroidota bacterium]
MNEGTEEQIKQWLKKLERESWQLELLVSAFTIFLLVAASESFSELVNAFDYEYSESTGVILSFLNLTLLSIWVLTGFLIIHLLLRGFWIGAIGLRSVNPSIDLKTLNYSDFFQKKFEKRLIGLDRLVVKLDEISSVIFSVSFLIIFTIISFGLYLLFIGVANAFFFIALESAGPSLDGVIIWVAYGILIILLLTGMIYMIDFFTLGFFKKFGILSTIYYPIYRFYSVITLSFISRSIYYNLISKYSKKRTRIFLTFFLCVLLYLLLFRFDQHIFFPADEDKFSLENNYYDDRRSESDYVAKVSVESRFSMEPYIGLFIRYDSDDNFQINSNCPDFKPIKNEGINYVLKFSFENGIQIRPENFEEEDKEILLCCLSELYEVFVNDSVCNDLKYYFARHPAKDQKGILTTISTRDFKNGENIIEIKKKYINSSDSLIKEDFARVPVWFFRD